MTYSGVSLNVTSISGDHETFSADYAGTVDLTQLTNLTKTIASIAVPYGWQVESVGLDISGIHIFINGTSSVVSPLSSMFTLPVSDSSPINASLAGSLLDFYPAVEQVQVVNATSGQQNYAYIFMPGGIALGEGSLNSSQAAVGDTASLTPRDSGRLFMLGNLYARDLSVTSSQLSAKGNVTTFSVTLRNNGSVPLPIFGISLKGQFNMTAVHYNCPKKAKTCSEKSHYTYRNSTIPFWVNGTALQPVLGSLGQGGFSGSSVYMLGANKTATFSFTGVIQALRQFHHGYNHIALTPISGDSYRLTAIGLERARFHITAT